MKPITPREARQTKDVQVPEEVVESFNELISERLTLNGSVSLKQSDVIERILSKSEHITRDLIFKNNWLDIEQIYRDNGWVVTYDKLAWNESGEPIFIFESK